MSYSSDFRGEDQRKRAAHDLLVREARAVVKDVVRALEIPHKPPEYHWLSRLTVNEVYEGGSLGKGTTVPYNFDVDLVILSKDITIEKLEFPDEKGHVKDIVADVKRYLLNDWSLKRQYKISIQQTYARSFGFVLDDGRKQVEIDLLVAPFFGSHHDEYIRAEDTMRDLKRKYSDKWDQYRTLLTPSLTRWQTEYIINQPDRVKELIKRLKKWKKEECHWKNGTPTSYLLEILLIVACRNYCAKQKWPMEKLDNIDEDFTDIAVGVQEELQSIVVEYRSLRLKPTPVEGCVWTSSGQARWDNCDVGEPHVMDPATGYNNLFISGMKGRDTMRAWGEFAGKLSSLDLRRPLFPID